jgi:transposase
MQKKNNTLDFSKQTFFIGLDVHKKQWTVTIRSKKIVLKTFVMNPSAEELAKYMQRHYPSGEYHSVYEAGFCGYTIHRELERNGFKNKIAAPTEIPTSSKEKNEKMDSIDSRKLARELENEDLKGIYIPSELQQEIRSLVRMRYQVIRSQTRLKNQIKSYLHYYGHKLPENFESRHWSKGFIEKLRVLKFNYPIGERQLELYLEELISKRAQLSELTKSIRKYLQEYKLTKIVLLLSSIPGIGFTTAVILYTELMDIKRFGGFDKLASYCGLIPSVRGSGEKEKVLGIKLHHNKYIRQLLVESAWMAIRKDPVLTLSYSQYLRRMSKQEAIIKIAKKLLSRISYCWRSGNKYVNSVVK